jgi:hypothetical protein
MAQIPATLYISSASQLGPIVVALARPARLSGGARWVAIWCGTYAAENAIALPMALAHHNNHILNYIFVPIQGAAILWALSLWQTQQMARLTMRAAIPGFLVAWTLLLFVENLHGFSAIAEPVYSILALGAALYTLVVRSSDATSSLLRQDWFWVCAGLALHFGALVFLTPLGAALVNTNPEIVVRAYYVRSFVNILAFTLMTIGLLCPRPLPHSGPFFSPASSA